MAKPPVTPPVASALGRFLTLAGTATRIGGGRPAWRGTGSDERPGTQARADGVAVAGRAAAAGGRSARQFAEPRTGVALRGAARSFAAGLWRRPGAVLPAYRRAALCRRVPGPGAPCGGPGWAGAGAQGAVPRDCRDLRGRPAPAAPFAAAGALVPCAGQTAGRCVSGTGGGDQRRARLPRRDAAPAAFSPALRRLAGPAPAAASGRPLPAR